MTKTHRERYINNVKDKELLNYLYTHLDRAQDRNSGAAKNLLIHSYSDNEETKQEKLLAARDYLVEQMEDLSALRFAIKTMHKRVVKTRRQVHNMCIHFTRIKGEIAPPREDVTMPDLWNDGGIFDE